MPELSLIKTLLATLPQVGRVTWIGIRPSRGAPMVELNQAAIKPGTGLEGDRFQGRAESRRQVTLIQHEHLPVIAACLHLERVEPALLRRNIVVSGINLLALKDKRFRVGDVLLEYTGLCHPCSKMEQLLGPGGYNALRGHGGITARVIEAGEVKRGDDVDVGEIQTRGSN
ncbi:MOSC domain-containing protein [Allohahella marinimesophila]|uniref:MOSC domain-containing protein n=1 Tax=Allohahella marinimesophila TaxID=1054972 RepID=A0ABP7P665_9GAMM